MKQLGNIFLFVLLFLSLAIQPAHLENLGAEGRKYYELGIKYYTAGDYELALNNFLQAAEINPGNELIVQYINRTGNELKKKREQELLQQAINDYQEQNFEVSLDKFVRVLDLNPRNREAVDYIQKIKEEATLIEKGKGGPLSEEEKPEVEKREMEKANVEKLKSPELSKIVHDIEKIKKEIAKAKLEETKKLPEVISKKGIPIGRIYILLLLFTGVLTGTLFAYVRKVLKKRELSNKNLELMENLSKTATNVERKEEILENIIRVFVQAVEAKSGALFTVEDKTGDLVLGAGVELNPHISRNFKFNKDSPVFAEISRITSPTSATEISQDSVYENLLLFKEKPVSPSSFLLIPLIYKNRSVGVVLLSSKRGGGNYLRKHKGLIETLAGQSAIIVANIIYDRQVIIDGLTGLYVHWFFYQCLEKEISRAERQSSSLALLMVDLDHFKQFNDKYGHPTGDKALVKVAEILRKDLRDIDTVARYGGEEFAVILPGVDKKLALRTAERIRKDLESYRFNVVNGKYRLTLSIGISIYEKGVTTEEMVERADKALYWVKQHGRNQVKSWENSSPDNHSEHYEG